LGAASATGAGGAAAAARASRAAARALRPRRILLGNHQLEVELQIRHALEVDRLFLLYARNMARITSTDFSSRSDIASVTCMAPLRSSSSIVSRLCVKEAMSEKPNCGAAALDGMGNAEDGVDQLFVRRPDVELEERRLHRVQSLEALLEEGIMKLVRSIVILAA